MNTLLESTATHSASAIAAAEAERVATAQWDASIPELIQTRRALAALQAREAALLAGVYQSANAWSQSLPTTRSQEAELPFRAAAAEIAAAWRVSDRTVQRQLEAAADLVSDYPETLRSLAAGRISAAHVRVIQTAGAVITGAELRHAFESDVLDYAEAESATRLAPVARRRAEWYAQSSIDDRHARARATRRVSITDLDDGMSELLAVLPSVLAHGIHDRLTQMARGVREAGDGGGGGVGGGGGGVGGGGNDSESDAVCDERSLDELRADVLADLTLSTSPSAHSLPTGIGAIAATVQVTVPVLTLIDDAVADPCELVMLGGRVPIDAAMARELAASAPGWDRILTHPITGEVLGVDRYRPSEQMRRHLRVRDEHCRFPGCRMPARACDVDHTVDHAHGGATSVSNLAHLCRRHHTLKHHTRWQVSQHPGGTLEWRSPTGRVYRDKPVSSVAFSPDAEHDPPPF